MTDSIKLPLICGMMAVGGWLLLTARRRAAGSGPHCASCGYNLSHLESSRCPECGLVLSPDTISDGPPSRFSWGRFWIGAAMVFVPAIWVVIDFGMAIMRMPTPPVGG
ncbi:MAG: hypothetical protein H6818_21355 [Phycisphaerales bacterium]|nr:hypothetical protein [Phycisphaerales bacterium]MCB9862339.1 hypothetical protein [Phycisphaerales bacterium]